MDRRRHLDALGRLDAIQRLREAEAQAQLAAALTQAHRATAERYESEKVRREAEMALDHILSLIDLDPEALRRGGSRLIAAEDAVAEHRAVETAEHEAAAGARREWHRHRLCGEALAERGRRLRVKLARLRDEKCAVERASFASSKGRAE